MQQSGAAEAASANAGIARAAPDAPPTPTGRPRPLPSMGVRSYALRAARSEGGRRRPAPGGDASAAALAAVDAGLLPAALSKEERVRFRASLSAYFDAR